MMFSRNWLKYWKHNTKQELRELKLYGQKSVRLTKCFMSLFILSVSLHANIMIYFFLIRILTVSFCL
jgi:hypothetical protein